MISIIIPSRQLTRSKNIRYFYRPLTSLPDLIESIDAESPWEVIVVCNGTNDKSLVEFVRSNPKINKHAILSHNAGVARAWNIGRQMAEGDKLLFVNDDAVFGADAFKILSRAEHEFERLGVIGPKGSIWRDCKHETFVNGTGKVDVVSGFAFLVSAKIFDQVGGIDVEYTPAGCEEVDFCFKVSAAGYQNYAHEKIPIKTEPAHGISARNESIHYFNSTVMTGELHLRNTAYLRQKWSKPL